MRLPSATRPGVLAQYALQTKFGFTPERVVAAARKALARARAFCADKLARFKTPKSIDFIADMPRDPNGKLYKRKLRDPYWQGRERRI